MRTFVGPLCCFALALLAGAAQARESQEATAWKRFLSKRRQLRRSPVESQDQAQQDEGQVSEDHEALLAERDDLRAQLATKNQEFLAQHRRADHLALEVISLRSKVKADEAREQGLEAKLNRVRAVLSDGNDEVQVKDVARPSATDAASPEVEKVSRHPKEAVSNANAAASPVAQGKKAKTTVKLQTTEAKNADRTLPRVSVASVQDGGARARAPVKATAGVAASSQDGAEFQQVDAQLEAEDRKIDKLSKEDDDSGDKQQTEAQKDEQFLTELVQSGKGK